MDLTMILRDLPLLASKLHYRAIDVSTLRLALESWADVEHGPSGNSPHRARADVHNAIDRARKSRAWLRHASKLVASDREERSLAGREAFTAFAL
jgi:oligoribonuclease (3'-5' exoribonuclease)